MARRVFFSFHYDRDIARVMQIRNSWVARPGDTAQPFYDYADFEEVKRRAGGIKNWIDNQLSGSSVTVVLFGAKTHERPWVKYEIAQSRALRKGIVAIDIHNMKNLQSQTDVAGRNPLLDHSASVASGFMTRTVDFTQLYRTYDWVRDNGHANIGTWVEAAAQSAGR
ncbi:MAG: TIR domain-containing protein [Neoaquamicrobium sediminum]|uniref:TIR domain-containing protein n=1 Tax=Neoaquamicrobium sediminum TaxID=1849104 RepID=UPI004036F357